MTDALEVAKHVVAHGASIEVRDKQVGCLFASDWSSYHAKPTVYAGREMLALITAEACEPHSNTVSVRA